MLSTEPIPSRLITSTEKMPLLVSRDELKVKKQKNGLRLNSIFKNQENITNILQVKSNTANITGL